MGTSNTFAMSMKCGVTMAILIGRRLIFRGAGRGEAVMRRSLRFNDKNTIGYPFHVHFLLCIVFMAYSLAFLLTYRHFKRIRIFICCLHVLELLYPCSCNLMHVGSGEAANRL